MCSTFFTKDDAFFDEGSITQAERATYANELLDLAYSTDGQVAAAIEYYSDEQRLAAVGSPSDVMSAYDSVLAAC